MEEIERLVRKGKELVRQKEWEQARECFRKILKMRPPSEIDEEIRELDYDCFLMLSDEPRLPAPSQIPLKIDASVLSRWKSAKTPRERRAILAEVWDASCAFIEESLRNFEKQIDEVIASAVKEYKGNPRRKDEIYEKALNRIDEILGPGCLGPATAAVGPLEDRKKEELRRLFNKTLGENR